MLLRIKIWANEQDINFFLLLKNELSLAFLRKEENILQTLRLGMHIDA